VVEAIVAPLGIGPLTFVPTDDPVFQPGRCARITAGNQALGVIGEVHPRVTDAFGVIGRVMLAELDLEPIVAMVVAHRGVLRQLPVTSRYPATENDFAVVVDESVAAADVAQVIAQAVGTLGQRVQLFDLYRGDQVPTGKKSLTFAVTMQAPDRALSEAEVTKVRDRVSQALAKRLKATLRS
jgi:phenylalanyl-tRNA synthetase beta chain